MKAKHNIPKKGKRLESPKVEPPKQPVAPPNEKGWEIDLRDLSELSHINDVLEKLYRSPRPSATDCVDEARRAYNRACALLIYADYAEQGLMAEGSALVEPAARYVMDSIRLQLDIVRLAGEHLFSRCRADDSRNSWVCHIHRRLDTRPGLRPPRKKSFSHFVSLFLSILPVYAFRTLSGCSFRVCLSWVRFACVSRLSVLAHLSAPSFCAPVSILPRHFQKTACH